MKISRSNLVLVLIMIFLGILIFTAVKMSENYGFYPEYEAGVTVRVVNQTKVKLPDLKFSLGYHEEPNHQAIGSIKGLSPKESEEIHVSEVASGGDLNFIMQYKDANNNNVLDSPYYISIVNPRKVVTVITVEEVTDSGLLNYEYEGYDSWDKIGPHKYRSDTRNR